MNGSCVLALFVRPATRHTVDLRLARDHAVYLDRCAGLRVGVDHDHGRRSSKPCAHLTLADILGGTLRTVALRHPNGLALVEGTVAYVGHDVRLTKNTIAPDTSLDLLSRVCCRA